MIFDFDIQIIYAAKYHATFISHTADKYKYNLLQHL